MCDKISEKIKNQTILTKNKHYLFIHYLMKFWIMNIKKKKLHATISSYGISILLMVSLESSCKLFLSIFLTG